MKKKGEKKKRKKTKRNGKLSIVSRPISREQRKGESPWRRYFPGIGLTRRSTQMRARLVIK